MSSLFVISKLLKTADPFSPKNLLQNSSISLLKQVFKASVKNFEILNTVFQYNFCYLNNKITSHISKQSKKYHNP